MAPFGDGGEGGGGGGGGGDEAARRGWDPLRSGSAPPTMEGAAEALFGAGAGAGAGGLAAEFFAGRDGLGARADEAGWRRGGVPQEHFGNSSSLSVGPPGMLLNGTGELDERQFGPSRVHNVGGSANYSALTMGSLWTDMGTEDAEFRRNVQNRFLSNLEKRNAYGTRDPNALYLQDSDISDALSELTLSNSREMSGRKRDEELLEEIFKHRRGFSSKIGDDRPNVFHTPRPERLDVRPLPTYGDGILRRHTSMLDGSNVSRMGRHHIKDLDHISFADQLAVMRSGNLRREVDLVHNAASSNMINPISRRYNSIPDLDVVRNRKAFIEDLYAQQYVEEDSLFEPLPYSDSRMYRDEPYIPYSRMRRPGSPFHPNMSDIPYHRDRQSRLSSFSRRATGRIMGSQAYHDNAVSNYLDFPLGNADGADSVQLVDIVGHVKDVSIDQFGSRFIQQKLENASADDREKIFPEILSNAIVLTTDVFGNYVIQKFFEFATDSQLIQLADKLKGHILELSLQMYGCRVVQKVLDVVDMDRKIDIVHELKNCVLKCIADQNGNHVIQKCIECVPEDRIPFVIGPILSQIFLLCTHQYGCRVIQRVLEHCHDPATQNTIMEEIVQHTSRLTDDKFGNYVVQHVLQHGKPEERSSIIQKLSGQVVILSKQKFASNVIEKCLTFGTPEERDGLIGEIISSGQTFQELMKDQFGNYVVQRVLQTCDDKYLEMILSSIKLHLNELKNYTYGKHIVARVEKLIVTGEKRARMVFMNAQHQQSPHSTDVDANPF
ncbi:hypothetical protein ACP4OV_030444 [Aristida adscensionis]